jgi:hypothetical protein
MLTSFDPSTDGWTAANVYDSDGALVISAKCRDLRDGRWEIVLGRTTLFVRCSDGDTAKKHMVALIRERLFNLAMGL